MNKFTESLADVMRYIVHTEMKGQVDPKHHLYPTYLDIKDMFEQLRDDNEILDLQSHSVIRSEQSDLDMHPDAVYGRKWLEKERLYKNKIGY